MTARIYATRRQGIVEGLVEKLKTIDGTEDFLSDVQSNVSPKLLFWDEVQEFPSIHVSAGPEARRYQGGGYRDRFLSLSIRIYVKEENAINALDALLEDIETVIESCSRLEYKDKLGNTQYTQQISITSIITDEGALEPLGVGEITCQVQY